MSCNCLKKNKTSLDMALISASKELAIDKCDYVIYKLEETIYYDRKDCWIKVGKPGELLQVLYY